MQIGSALSSGSTNFSGRSAGVSAGTDSQTKNIQKQIENAQKQLQELAGNDQLSSEDKMKKRQEINQQISDLNKQLRQHQNDLRKEKLQSTGSSTDDIQGGQPKANSTTQNFKGTGLSQESMMAVISGDTVLKQAQVQERVVTNMNGRVGVLESEIKLNKLRGASTTSQEAELTDTQENIKNATSSQIEVLADANGRMSEADKTDKTEESIDKMESNNTTETPAVANTETDENAVLPAGAGSQTIFTVERSAFLGVKSMDIRV
ncbi:FlxA-like family protein [Acetobacterium tundrae]|uniref:FlxA-like protein n=1 Tax=Acetobacterium tundrae TaxID=132932 RepID=A0ABR6WJQ5_9FIRM|nr:FlxA-like family protein [Acetobacterium tundrae]MBC3796405.1 hypothetical protein [Acetobacterium tundrae]